MKAQAVNVNQPMSLFVVVAYSAIAVLIFNALPVIMGVASDALALSDQQLGLLASLELAGIGITSVSGLYWIRRVSWRPTVALGILALVVGNTLSAFASGATELIALRFFTGLLGEGVIFTVAIAAIGDAEKTDRAFAFSIVGQVALGMVALGSFPYVAQAAGYSGVMGVMAVLALLSLFLLPWLPASGGGAVDTAADGAAPLITWLPLLGLLAMLFWFLGLSGIWTFVERIGVEIPLTQQRVGSLLSLGLGLGALASLTVALVGDRYGRRWPPLAAIAIHVLMCIGFTGTLTATAFGAMVLIFTFVWNLGLPYILGMICDSDASGRLVVLIVSAQAFGNTAGPLIAGNVAAQYGVSGVGWSSAGLCAVALCVAVVFAYHFRPASVR
jgi:predicted MFS family arabinose efflux permease